MWFVKGCNGGWVMALRFGSTLELASGSPK